MLRKPWAADGLQRLRAELRRAEDGERPMDYLPATAEDEKALGLYTEGMEQLALGHTGGLRLVKSAARLGAWRTGLASHLFESKDRWCLVILNWLYPA